MHDELEQKFEILLPPFLFTSEGKLWTVFQDEEVSTKCYYSLCRNLTINYGELALNCSTTAFRLRYIAI